MPPRMSRLSHWKRVKSWRDKLIRQQMLDPIWGWFKDTAELMSITVPPEATTWNFPPMEMIEPDKEGLATMRNVRTGIQSYREVVQERGKNYANHLKEMEVLLHPVARNGDHPRHRSAVYDAERAAAIDNDGRRQRAGTAADAGHAHD